MKRFVIAIGTTSEQKISHVKEILKEIGVAAKLIPVWVKSDISEQPLTEKESLNGSLNRARNALLKERKADFALGIEIGYHRNKQGYEMFCYASIVDKNKRKMSAISSKFLLPEFHQEKLMNNLPLGDYVRNYLIDNKEQMAVYVRDMVTYRMQFITESVRNVLLSYIETTINKPR